MVGRDDNERLVEHAAGVQRSKHAGEPVVHQPYRPCVQVAHALQRLLRHLEPARARPPDRLQRQVAPRLLGRPQPPEQADVGVRARRQVGRMALIEVREPEERRLRAPPVQDRARRARAVVDPRARSLERPARPRPRRGVVQAALAARLHRAELVEAGVEPAVLADPQIRADAGSRVPGAPEHLGQEAVAMALDHRAAALRRARRRARQARRPRQQSCEHRGVRGQRPAGRTVRIPGHHTAAAEIRDGRRSGRLQRVAPRAVEHDQHDVRHGTIPSTNGTSKTFSCMTGPCPKKRSSPKSSPWSDVTITHVFDGSRSNSCLNTPSM